jgi:hypothetical protein
MTRIVVALGAGALLLWSTAAVALHAVTETLSGWIAGLSAAEGGVGPWVRWAAEALDHVNLPLIALVWVFGAALIVVVSVVLRRLTP